MTYAKFDEEDLKLFSGPRVWPSTTAWSIIDRFIQRRPELAYRRALKKAENPTKITVTISFNITSSSQSFVAGRFHHYIDNEESPLEDTQRFLKELKAFLERNSPSEPSLNTSCSIFLKQGAKYLASFQEAWI